MLNNLRKHALLPSVRRWDSMFDSVMGKLDLFPGEELHSELNDYIHPEIEITEHAVTVRISLPGFTKQEISVEIENDLLTVRTEHAAESHPHHAKGQKMLRSERLHTEVTQTVRLPGNIKCTNASAVYADGVLTVRIPRENNNCAFSRKIEVK